MKYFVIPFLIIFLISTFVISANAEEFDFEFIDSKNYTIYYKLTNATLVDIMQYPPEEFVFEVNGTSGEIHVSLPKTIPRYIHDDFPAFVLLNSHEYSNYTELNCFYDYVFPVEGDTKIQFIFGYPPERPLPIYYDDLPVECIKKTDSDSDGEMQIKDITCSNENLLKVINVRNEAVCVFSSSIDPLLERGYLQPTDVVVIKK